MMYQSLIHVHCISKKFTFRNSMTLLLLSSFYFLFFFFFLVQIRYCSFVESATNTFILKYFEAWYDPSLYKFYLLLHKYITQILLLLKYRKRFHKKFTFRNSMTLLLLSSFYLFFLFFSGADQILQFCGICN
jgi:hypothetical protein